MEVAIPTKDHEYHSLNTPHLVPAPENPSPLSEFNIIKTEAQARLVRLQQYIQDAEGAERSAISDANRKRAELKKLLEKDQGKEVFYFQVEELAATDPKLQETLVLVRKAVSNREAACLTFAREFTSPMPDEIFAEVEPGKAPGRYDTPSCREVPLSNFDPLSRHHADRGFNTAWIPWLPTEEDAAYFRQPENRVPVDLSSLSRLDRVVCEMITPYLQKTGLDIETWLNWCWSKQIRGTSVLAAEHKGQHLKDVLLRVRTKDPKGNGVLDFYTKKGGCYNGYSSENDHPFIHIPHPDEFHEFRREVRKETSNWYGTEYNIHRGYANVALARWDREGQYDLYHPSAFSLIDMYKEFLAALELNYPHRERANYGVFKIAHSYPMLVMGGRQEQYYTGAYITNNDGDVCLDYFDAFMLVAAEAELNTSAYTDQKEALRSPRCLFADHDIARSLPEGILLNMATMYFRMDDRQKEIYERDIELAFRRIEASTHLFTFGTPDMLTVPGTNSVRQPDESVTDPFERAKRIVPAIETAQKWHGDLALKMAHAFPVARSLSPKIQLHLPDNPDLNVEGLRADCFTVVEGVLVQKPERPNDPGTEIIAPQDLTLALTTKDRAGAEIAHIVETLLEKPEDGNLDRLSAVTSLLEALTGLSPEDRDMFSLITWLGNLEKQASLLPDASRENVDEILAKCAEKPEFAGLDNLSQLMLVYTTFGFIPKEMVVERILKSAQSATSLFTVRTALLFEEIRKKDLEQRGIDTTGYVSPVFTAKEKLLQAARLHGPDSREYRQELELATADIMKHLATYMEYDWSVGTGVEAMLALKHTGTFFSMCGPQAELASSLINWITFDPLSYTAYREINHRLPLGEWYKMLSMSGVAVDHDHILAQIDLPGEVQPHRLIVDQTTQHLYRTDRVIVDEKRTKATKNSRVEEYPHLARYSNETNPSWVAVCYGAREKGKTSTLLGDLTLDFPQLSRYRNIFSPDELLQLRSIVMDDRFTPEERQQALRTLVQVAPRVFARILAPDNEEYAAALGKGLGDAMSLASISQDYVPELFIANILANHGAMPIKFREEGRKARKHCLQALSTFSKDILDKMIKSYKELLTSEDETDIWSEWEKEQERLRKLAEEQRRQKLATKRNKARHALGRIGKRVGGFFEETLEELGTVRVLKMLKIIPPSDEDKLTLGDELGDAIQLKTIQEAVRTAKVNQKQVLDKGWHKRADLSQPEDLFYCPTHLIEIKPEVAQKTFASMLDPLPEADRQKALIVLEVVLAKAEIDHFGGEPHLVRQAWQRLENNALALGYTLPYSRDELLGDFDDIVRSNGLLEGAKDIAGFFSPT